MTLIHSIRLNTSRLVRFRKTRIHVNQGKTQCWALFLISKATFTKTEIKPKFVESFSLKNFSAAIDQCTKFKISEFRVHWKPLKLSSKGANLSKYWSVVINLAPSLLRDFLLSRTVASVGVSTAAGGVRKAGFKGGGGVELSFSSFCKIAAWFKSGDALKGLRGVESTVLGNSGTALFISPGRVLEVDCSLKARYLFCNWRYRLAFSSSRSSIRDSTSSVLPCIFCIAGRSGKGEIVCCFSYFRNSGGMLSWNPVWLKTSSLSRTFVRSRQLSCVVVFRSISGNQRVWHSLFVLV